MSMHCTSCGSTIPDGQGSSCSMCYGDIAHGRDGFYEAWGREQEQKQAMEAEEALRDEERGRDE